MSLESKIQTGEGVESHGTRPDRAPGSELPAGLSILDIVKHSVKVIIRLLSEQDRISLVRARMDRPTGRPGHLLEQSHHCAHPA